MRGEVQLLYMLGVNVLLGSGAYLALSAGMLPLCFGSIAAVGALTGTLLYVHSHVPLPICLLIAMMSGAIFGALIGLLFARLRGFVFALATLATAELAEITVVNVPMLGGATGLVGPSVDLPVALLISCCLSVIVFLIWFERTGVRHAFGVLRADEELASSVGISPMLHRTVALALGGAVAGCGGLLNIIGIGILEPQSYGVVHSLTILAFVLLGGSATVLGPILGAVTLTIVPEVLRMSPSLEIGRTGIALVIVMVLRPDGILGKWRPMGVWRSMASRTASAMR